MNTDLKYSSSLQPGSRLDVLDALRGLAMMGIMMVNFPSINTFATKETNAYGGIENSMDKFFAQLNFILFNGKFYPIFATLFGLGCFIFYQNVLAKNLNAKWLFARRLAALALFGALHVFFVWWGDILLFYASLGFIYILFINLSAKRVFQYLCFFLLFFPAIKLILDFLDYQHLISYSVPLVKGIGHFDFTNEHLLNVYSQGTFLQIAKQRMIDYVHDFTFLFEPDITAKVVLEKSAYVIQVFGCFLLGLFIGKMQWHKNVKQKMPQIKKLSFVFGLFSLVFSVIAFLPGLSFIKNEATLLQGEFFSIFYILIFVQLLTKYRTSFIFQYFQAVGKMSFTSYIAHTTAGSLLLYSYGFALFTKVGPAQLFFISIGYYCVVAVFCKLWLQKFQFGPFEYLWRSITYYNAKKIVASKISAHIGDAASMH